MHQFANGYFLYPESKSNDQTKTIALIDHESWSAARIQRLLVYNTLNIEIHCILKGNLTVKQSEQYNLVIDVKLNEKFSNFPAVDHNVVLSSPEKSMMHIL